MHDPPLVLIVDDNADNREILQARLGGAGYATAAVADGRAALQAVRAHAPDLLLLDVMMPELDGFEVTRRIKADQGLPFLPIVLVTAKSATADLVNGLDAGADDFLAKPFEHQVLLARVRSMLRVKALHDLAERQKGELAAWNERLELRVRTQVGELERLGRLRRFLPPQVAEVLLARGEAALSSRRTEVAVVFADLRGFTGFAEVTPAAEVMAALGAFHGFAGPLIHAHGGTLERFLGDGVVALFNAPLPSPDPAGSAVRLACALRDGFGAALARWRPAPEVGRSGIGLGLGIAHGEATVGPIGFADRLDYAAIGRVPNLAARLCAAAGDGEILIDRATAAAVADRAPLVATGPLGLKGFASLEPVFTIRTPPPRP
jgi:adenylate cyclase